MATKRLRVGIVGSGKRVREFYIPILSKLSNEFDLVGFTTRTRENGEKLAIDYAVPFLPTAEELVKKKKPDVLVVAIKPSASAGVAMNLLDLKVPLLLETPVESSELIGAAMKSAVTIGVVEQWPFLPLEQFKVKLITDGLIMKPFLAQNDCRSLDYHAMAQLRGYVGRDLFPIAAVGHGLGVDMPAYADINAGVMKAGTDVWNIGTVKLNNGSILQHTFAYSCKKAPFRGLQSLRFNSQNGSVMTGKLHGKGNDYEIIDVRLLDKYGDTKKLVINVQRDKRGNVVRIFDAEGSFGWDNPYAEWSLDDHSIAIATHLTAMRKTLQDDEPILYTLQDAYVDSVCMHAIKQSASTGNAVTFQTQ